MINLNSIPGWLRIVLIVVYTTYCLALGPLAATVAGLSILNVVEIELDTDVLILLGLSLVAPLIPFATQIVLPGGTKLTLSRNEADQLRAIGNVGVQRALTKIATMDLEELFEPEESLEAEDDTSS